MFVGTLLCLLDWCVHEGGLANLYGMVCATCMRGMGVMVPFEVPSIASELAMSFPLIHVWALTFWIVILCRNHVMCSTINVISSLSG
jgi:hypothetical protein